MDDRAAVATEVQFRTLLECAEGVAVFVLNAEGRVVSWNDGAARITGHSRDEVLEQPFSTFYRSNEENETPAALCATARREGRAESVGRSRGDDGHPLELEVRPTEAGTRNEFVAVLRSTGSEYSVRNADGDGSGHETALEADVSLDYPESDVRADESAVEPDPGGHAEGANGGLDPSCDERDRRAVESDISTGLFEVAEEALYRLDTDGRFVTVSEGVASITGYSQETLLGKHASHLFDAETVDRLHPLGESAGRTGVAENRTTTATLETATDATLECEVRSRVIGSDERVRGSVGVIESVSERVGGTSTPEHQRKVVQRLLDTAPVALAVRDSQTGVTLGNARGRELFGLVAENGPETSEQPVRFFDADDDPIPVDDRPSVRAERTLEPVYGEELVVERTAENRRSFLVDAVPVRNEAGELSHVVAAAEDITEQKQQTERLRRQRRQLRTELSEVHGRVTDAVFALDTEWRFTYVNDTGEELLQRSEAELIGESVWEAFPEAVGTTFESEYRELMDREGSTTFVEYFAPLSKWFEVRAYSSETGVSVYFRDVTEQCRREQELEQYEAIVETVDDAVYVVDDDARFTLVNDAFVSLVGYSRSELLGTKSELLRADDIGETVEMLTQEQLDGERGKATVESRIRRRDGTVFPAATTITPFPSDGGGYGRVGVVRDITEHREREQQLESLSEATGRLLNADSPEEIAAITVEAAETALDGSFVSVSLYDEESGALRPQTRSPGDERFVDIEQLLDPDTELAWQVYADDDPSVFRGVEAIDDETASFDVVVYPLGRHGVFIFGESDAPETTNFARILAANTESALDRADREARLVDQQNQLREQNQTLGRLNRVNDVTRQILQTLVDATSRTEIERSVCEQLTTTGPYRFAWVGSHSIVDDTVAPRTSAGFDSGYLARLRELTDPSHPSVRAAEGIDPVVVDNLHDDPPFDPWRSEALKRGYQSLICLPLRYRGTSYGVLCVYADRPNVFDEMERSVLRELSNTAAYAINAAESKRSLVGDSDVELELTVEDDSSSYLRASEELDCTLTLDDLLTPEEDGLQAIFTARGADADSVVAFMNQQLDVGKPRLIDESEAESVCECTVGVEHIFQVFVDHGVVPREFDASDGVGSVTVTVSEQFDVRAFVEMLRAKYDHVELTARREQPKGSTTLGEVRTELSEQLTDRQREALKTALVNGFFESPRTSGEREIAERLGIAQSTLNGHLRAGQRKILELLYRED
ncbi:hypothetical protein AUR64_06070 [Haloprofundus marisrubri]|uniref:PAS sensor protein n=1 Tax=Haloprofundus marisrubri TaxID=1514971 RepID=A0A0W1RB94_9EURY|nr:PAS domain S-box protein [Haloprofundus marisrubri]KTG10754.1 hypothetical protein AUR64_06070 [Haloprofundus marisrubri]